MIPELPNDKVSGCISGQYPYQKAHKITRSKIMSLGMPLGQCAHWKTTSSQYCKTM